MAQITVCDRCDRRMPRPNDRLRLEVNNARRDLCERCEEEFRRFMERPPMAVDEVRR